MTIQVVTCSSQQNQLWASLLHYNTTTSSRVWNSTVPGTVYSFYSPKSLYYKWTRQSKSGRKEVLTALHQCLQTQHSPEAVNSKLCEGPSPTDTISLLAQPRDMLATALCFYQTIFHSHHWAATEKLGCKPFLLFTTLGCDTQPILYMLLSSNMVR